MIRLRTISSLRSQPPSLVLAVRDPVQAWQLDEAFAVAVARLDRQDAENEQAEAWLRQRSGGRKRPRRGHLRAV